MNEYQRPLITFVVMAYNQERHIREAVEGAFSQTYRPLEIILSDDCSVDRTFDIMREMAAVYDGPHAVSLNRNATNQGLGGHVNRVVELANGELIVMSAGDDISLKDRTQRTYEAWEESGKEAYSLFTNMYKIDSNGSLLEVFFNIHKPPIPPDTIQVAVDKLASNVYGCSHAFHRDLFSYFGPIPNDIYCEDVVIPFRALLLNKKIIYINDILVKYRTIEGSNLSENTLQIQQARLHAYEQWRLDASKIYVTLPVKTKQHRIIKAQIEVISNIDSKRYLHALYIIIKYFFRYHRFLYLKYLIRNVYRQILKSIAV